MQFNTKKSNLFKKTRIAFKKLFIETRSIAKWFKAEYVAPSQPLDGEEIWFQNFRDKCPAAVLHVRDAWHAMDRIKEGLLKTTGRALGLLWSCIIELPLLVARNLIIDIITFPLNLVKGFTIDVFNLALNLIQDVASIPALIVSAVADRKSRPAFVRQQKHNPSRQPSVFAESVRRSSLEQMQSFGYTQDEQPPQENKPTQSLADKVKSYFRKK